MNDKTKTIYEALLDGLDRRVRALEVNAMGADGGEKAITCKDCVYWNGQACVVVLPAWAESKMVQPTMPIYGADKECRVFDALDE